MINKAILVGRLGGDPSVRYMPNGGQVTSFSVATDEKWKDKQTGEWVTKTEWINIVAFGKLAEICGQYLVKGKLVYVEGKIQTQQWTDKEGGKHSKTQIVADTMKMLDSKGGERQENSQGGPADPGANRNQEQDVPDSVGEVPF